MRVALVVEYDGTRYHGFQYQTNASSVQEELEKALGCLTKKNVRVKGAGRTDRGVHATGQVVSFDVDAVYSIDTIVGALNWYLPNDVAVKAAYQVGEEFDPRRHATSRTYIYTISLGSTRSPLDRFTTYYVKQNINVRVMEEAVSLFVGRHDFCSFVGKLDDPESSTVREIVKAEVSQCSNKVRIEFEGNAFLNQQVRRMAGVLLALGRGDLTKTKFKSMIETGQGDSGNYVLPPEGLCLIGVKYNDSVSIPL